jgi:hypothetical protein
VDISGFALPSPRPIHIRPETMYSNNATAFPSNSKDFGIKTQRDLLDLHFTVDLIAGVRVQNF